MRSVYIHIPFCKNICSYCDFCKFLYNKKWIGAYLVALKNEIHDRYLEDEITSIYIGGGTPSILDIEDTKYLFKILDVLNKSSDCEITFECNMEDINEEKLKVLKDNQVTRLSIGIQTFNKKMQEFLERSITFKEAKAKIKLCRNMGFNNINLDLMYAIPGQRLKDLKKDLKRFLKLDVEHISPYSLIIEEHTKLSVRETTYIEEELDYDMFKLIEKKLKNYHHYEISNYALKGYESKHNLKYWKNEEYYGFGLSASGYIDNTRYENTKNLKDYLEGKWVMSSEIVGEQEKMNYEVMLGLRLLKGINKKEFKEKYQKEFKDVYNIDKLLKNKDLIDKKGYIFINKDKIYIMNEILLKII